MVLPCSEVTAAPCDEVAAAACDEVAAAPACDGGSRTQPLDPDNNTDVSASGAGSRTAPVDTFRLEENRTVVAGEAETTAFGG